MTTYTTIADADIDPESPGTTTLFTRMRDNPIAITEGAGGAPSVVYAALSLSNDIAQSDIASGAIGQGELKTATGSISQSIAGTASYVLPGGEYGFWARSTCNVDSFGGEDVSITISQLDEFDNADIIKTLATYVGINIVAPTSGGSATVHQRYIQASPPYDLGDGEVSLFIFAEVSPDGNIVSAYEAPEAPWHHNGPTKTGADFYDKNGIGYRWRKDTEGVGDSLSEAKASGDAGRLKAYLDAFQAAPTIAEEITQEIKQADMGLLPRPMEPRDGNTVILIDPVSLMVEELFTRKEHDQLDILELLHDNWLTIDNSPIINRAGPPGVPIHGMKWRTS